MIAGLDSSIDRPTPAQAAAAYAAGVRAWGGYLPPGLALESPWDRASFEIVQAAGLRAIGFASGNDDPVQVAATARAWGVLGCLDDEDGIRPEGPWVQAWLDASGFGLYGLGAVHIGRRAPFHVVALYPGADPGATWPGGLQRPGTPVGWQWLGTHDEFGVSVDRAWYDDWFWFSGILGGNDMAAAPRPDGSAVDLFTVRPGGGCNHYVWTFRAGWGAPEDLAGGLLPHTLSAWWLGVELTVIGQAPDGTWWQNVYNAGWSGWAAAGVSSATAQPGPAGLPGPPGPPGPATFVRHTHQTDAGTPT